MKQLYFIIIVFALAGFTVSAQNRIGGVRIFPITLEERGDSLFLEMDVHVDGKAVNECQSWTIMPGLITADSAFYMEMPRALVNGKTKAKLFKRKVKFGNEYLLSHFPAYKIDKRPGRDTTFRYTYQIPYEFWMDTASLRINQILDSCAGVDQWFVLDDMARVKLQPYIPFESNATLAYIMPDNETKTFHLEGSAFLDFQVGRSEILPNFRRNPQELAKINETLSKVHEDPDFETTGLFITGYASPEGNYSGNDRLSLARSEALRQYIQGRFPIQGRLIRVANVAEDWDGLVNMLNNSDMTGKQQVLDIIASVPDPDTRESRLRALNGGTYFRYMLNELFPALRRVEYRVEFTVKEYSLEESELILQKNPDQLNQYELTVLFHNNPDGSPERELAFNHILRMFPDDPIANHNAATRMLLQNNPERVQPFVEKIIDNPRSYNVAGVYYLLADDPVTAEEYFNKALSAAGPDMPYTTEDVRHNMEELDKKREDIRIKERYTNR